MTKRTVVARAPRHLLTRLLDTPNLAEVVPRLEPAVLHQLVRTCGLEDCGEVLVLATAQQLLRVFDDDLWRSTGPGEEEHFDAGRFGLWLEVLVEVDVRTAAQKLVEMDLDFVTAALSRHIVVLDQDSTVFGETREGAGEGFDPLAKAQAVLAENALDGTPSNDIGGYTVVAKRTGSWDALMATLLCLNEEHAGFFGKLMRRCCQLTTEYIEDNGGLYQVLTADEQVMADIASDREKRREGEGYVAPSQAVAFLKLARQRRSGVETGELDPVTLGYFREFQHRARAGGTSRNRSAHSPLRLTGDSQATTRLSRIRTQLLFVQEHDGDIYSRRTEELAYLANVLLAGCSFQSRGFRAGEAADAVLATCNLGLENWPLPSAGGAPLSLPPALLLQEDLVTVFRTGWSVVYEKVCLHVAASLVKTLSDLRCDDAELQDQIEELGARLKAALEAGAPWRERENLDVIAILDPPSWATLLNLVEECPVVPKATETLPGDRRPLRVASAFEFVSENSQVEWARDFARSLPRRLVET